MLTAVFPQTLANGTNVIQLETASGAGIKYFNNSIGMTKFNVYFQRICLIFVLQFSAAI